jgi:DnaJ-class molecular chaperone
MQLVQKEINMYNHIGGTMSGKIICPHCDGNGYRKIWKDTSEKEKVIIQCAKCNSEGEVDITDDVLKDLEKMTRLQ